MTESGHPDLSVAPLLGSASPPIVLEYVFTAEESIRASAVVGRRRTYAYLAAYLLCGAMLVWNALPDQAYTHPRIGQWLPKHAFKSETDIAQLRALIEQRGITLTCKGSPRLRGREYRRIKTPSP